MAARGEHHHEGSCPIERAAQLLGDAWTLLLLRDLANGPRRFTDLEASTGMSPRVLSQRLRELVSRGMINRRSFNEIPPRVEYSLTEKGCAALPVIDVLRAYGEQWLRDEVAEASSPSAGPHPSTAAELS